MHKVVTTDKFILMSMLTNPNLKGSFLKFEPFFIYRVRWLAITSTRY